MSKILILGAGGHARVLDAALRAAGLATNGFAGPGDEAALLAAGPTGVLLVNGVGSVGDAARRCAVHEKFREAGFRFLTIIHPSAIIAADAILDEGAQVMAGAILQAGVRLGEGAIVNTGAIVDHDSVVGAHAHVATGARLAGNVTVGAAAHIGAGATVVQGVTIGEKAIAGAGAVVISDVPPKVVVIGIPARQKS